MPAQKRAYVKNEISHIRVMRLKSTMSSRSLSTHPCIGVENETTRSA